jgi:hypothetical protein
LEDFLIKYVLLLKEPNKWREFFALKTKFSMIIRGGLLKTTAPKGIRGGFLLTAAPKDEVLGAVLS